jgi:release factor glutamine methyltransferase
MSTAEVWTVGRLLTWTTDYLKNHGAENPRLDAEVLLGMALGCQRIQLYVMFDDVPPEDRRTKFRELVKRRAEGTPVAYLVEQREFYSLEFRVTPDVLIPRPETELIVVAVLDLAKGKGKTMGSGQWAVDSKSAIVASSDLQSSISDLSSPNPQSLIPNPLICDLGTGSGILAVTLAKHLPGSRVTAVDISPAALRIAQENARKHSVADRVAFVESDLLAAVPSEQKFDVIVSNPPYVTEAEYEKLPADVRKFEPRTALVAGPKGTEIIERLIPQAAEHLRPGGHLLIEISPMIHDAARQLLESDGRFDACETIKDLARLPRVIWGKKRG